MNRAVGCLLGVVVVLLVGKAPGAPQAGVAATSWQLGFDFHDPQRISLMLPGDTEPTSFWYVLYRVTNNTDREVEFYPSFRLVTDTLDVVVGGDMISPSVYDAIAARHKKEYPFFTPPSRASGPLLRGRENARTSAAVFRGFDPKASSFTVYVSGLSGEIERVGNPTFDPRVEESRQNPRAFLFRRALAIMYDLPGDPSTQAVAVPIRRSREWVMR